MYDKMRLSISAVVCKMQVNMLTLHDYVHNSTRTLFSSSRTRVHFPKVHTSFSCSSSQFSAASDWNHLQQTLKLNSFIPLSTFKHSIKAIAQDQCTCF